MANYKHHIYNLSTIFLLLLLLLLLLLPQKSTPYPLSTSSRWIVDDAASGRRVKLACVNLVSHLEPLLAEGLSKLPIEALAGKITSLGFNCVRLTWPIHLVTNDSLGSLTVRESFRRLGLFGSLAGIQANNPAIVDLSLVMAFQKVVSSLGENNVMVILDNHITQPGWCCSNDDGNGFFNDEFFNPELWITGLTKMAAMFRGSTSVVGMSLRNELRGPRQNTNDWYKYMQKGAEAVHSANPDVLVVLSGLSFDTDLSFLSRKMVSLSFRKKLVFEMHWYGFSDGQAWANGNVNDVCGRVGREKVRNGIFLVEKLGYPLFVSEFGLDLRGTNVNDNRYSDCFMAYAAEYDFDWAYWTIVGSYYLRQGVVGLSEVYGLLNVDWTELRNQSFIEKIKGIQAPFQGPGLAERRQHQVIFHPSTGQCVLRGPTYLDPLTLGPCTKSDAWTYSSKGTLSQEGTYFCLKADELRQPVQLDMDCSNWEMISDSKLHLSTKLDDGTSSVCLDVDSDNNIVVNACKCLSKDKGCDPVSQWFKLVNSTRAPSQDDDGLVSRARKVLFKVLDLVLYYIGRMYGSLALRIARGIEG
ncbi:Glycosyl hydrolase 5 family protein [Linum grandiflorum]